MANLKVGAGKVSINPPKEMYPFPSNFAICDEMRDECFVRTILIDNGERKILFIIYELSDIPSVPELLPGISKETGIPVEDIIICVTHNHSSPCDRCKFPADPEKFEYFKKLEYSAGIEASRIALETLRPAKVGYGEIDSYLNVNRDLKTGFGFWVEGPCYSGYSNKTLAVMKFVDEDDKLIAAMLNFGAHAVCAFTQKDVDGKIKSSSNFPGIACQFVEDVYEADGAVVAWTSGAAGNQDPILWDYVWQEFPDGYVTKISLPDGSGYIHMDAIGARQGADAVACLKGITEYEDEIEIKYLKSQVPIPARKRDPNYKMPPFGLRMGGVGPRTDWSAPKMPEFPTLFIDPDKMINYQLDVLRVGKTAVILTSGELYAEIARDMMAAAPVDNKFVITHIPGQGGYTLDKGSKDHKTFQAFGGVEPGSADEPLANRTRELVIEAFK